MAYPTLKVEIAFMSDPLDDTPAYVDVTPYVRLADGVSISRGGVPDPTQPDQAGRCSFVLDDRERRFDWSHATGPYYGYLTPRRQVRISGTVSGVDYPIFKGWTTGFVCESRNFGTDAVVEVKAYDALGVLAGRRLTGDPLDDYVTTIGTAVAWWRTVSGTSWEDTIGAYTASAYSGAYPLKSTDSLLPSLKSNAFLADGQGWATIPAGISDSSDWTLGFWVKATISWVGANYYSTIAPIVGCYVSGVARGTVGINYLGYPNALLSDSTGTNYTDSYVTRVLNDGEPHHLMWTRSGSTITVYVDGVAISSTSAVTGTGYYTMSPTSLGARYTTSGDVPTLAIPYQILDSATVQDVILFSSALTATQVEAIYNLSMGVAVESTEDRVGRILDEVAWPAAWRDISTATRGECGPLDFSGQSALAELQKTERSEQGRMYATFDGKLAFRQRYYAYSDTVSNTVQLTFSDDGSNEKYRTFGHRRGDDDVINDVSVTSDTIRARAVDSTSQTTYDTNAASYDTVLSTYQQAVDMAAGVVFLYKDARIRLDPIAVSTSAAWTPVLQLELGSRIRVESTPMAVGSQMVADVLLESVGWDIGVIWTLTIAGSPIPPEPVDSGFWVLSTSKLGTGTVLAF